MAKFKRDRCEVCGEPVIDVNKLDPEIREQIYRPGKEETVELDFDAEPEESQIEVNA